MLVSEPLAALRTVVFVLMDDLGYPLPGISFSAGDVKVRKHGGAFANVTTLPTEVTGSADGIYALALSQTECNTSGPLIFTVVKTGVQPFVGSVQVAPEPAVTIDSVTLASLVEDVIAGINTSITLSAPAVAAIWDYVVETPYTAKDYMRGIASATFWRMSGALARNLVFKGANGIKNRIVATLNGDGRSAVQFNPED